MESKYYREHFWGVSQIQAVYQEREAQIGVDTSAGGFSSTDAKLLINGDRSIEILFQVTDLSKTATLFTDRVTDAMGISVQTTSDSKLNVRVGGVAFKEIPVNVGTLYHLVVTFSGLTAEVFLNGALEEKISITTTNPPTIYYIGGTPSTEGIIPFPGIIYHYRLFNYALTQGDVSKLWNNANPVSYVLPSELLDINLSHRYSFMSPMTLDGWTNVEGTDIPPVIEDGAIKCAFNETAVESYKNGIFRTFDNFTEGKLLIIKCKIKSTVAGNTVSYGFATNGFHLYGAQGAVLTTEWKEYVGYVTNNYLKIFNSIYFYGSYNTAQSGFYYIKDVEVIEAGCVGEYLRSNLVGNQDSTASAWINSAQQVAYNDSYKEPLLDNTNSSDLTAKREPKILYSESAWYGIEWRISASDPHCTRIGNLELHRTLPIQNKMRGCILNETGTVVTYLNPTDWTADSTARDGSIGDVMVEIPSHYRKFETIGDVCRCKISEYPLPGYHYVPTMYISAYEATVQRSTSKLASVVNTTEDYRGGNNNAEWDGTYRSLLGVPASNLTRIKCREYARNINEQDPSWNCLDYNVYKAVLWLYYVEYANRNSQDTFIEEKDSNGFAQGGLGAGVTTLDRDKWSTFNSNYPFIPCGYTDELGNGTGEVEFTMPQEYDTETLVVKVPRYRGIENPFGHFWKWTDGINVRISPNKPTGDGLSKVFVTDNPEYFNDSNYNNMSHVGNEIRTNSYVKAVIFGEGGEIMPSVVGGVSTTYFCDYHYTSIPTTETLHGVLFGGSAYDGAHAGFAFARSDTAPSYSTTVYGTRLCFIPQQK